MPEDAYLRIRTVRVYHTGIIAGFKFLDESKATIWSIGDTFSWLESKLLVF